MAGTKVYSFKSHRVVISHPDIGNYLLSAGGMGKITFAYSGDLARAVTAADGSTIINKVEGNAGTCNIEVPQVGEANKWLTAFSKYLKTAPTDRFALAQIVVTNDNDPSMIITAKGVCPQKIADLPIDAESQNRTWAMLVADLDM